MVDDTFCQKFCDFSMIKGRESQLTVQAVDQQQMLKEGK